MVYFWFMFPYVKYDVKNDNSNYDIKFTMIKIIV